MVCVLDLILLVGFRIGIIIIIWYSTKVSAHIVNMEVVVPSIDCADSYILNIIN